MRATLIREIVSTDYSGQNSVKTSETVEIDFDFLTPDHKEPGRGSPYDTCGEWRILTIDAEG